MKKILFKIFIVIAIGILIGVSSLGYYWVSWTYLYNIVGTATPQEVEKVAKNIKFINTFKAHKYIPHFGWYDENIIHHAAQYTNYPEVIEILINTGIDYNYMNIMLETPLDRAVSFNENPEIFKVFFKYNASPYDKFPETLISRAIMFNRNPMVLKELLNDKKIKNNYDKKSDFDKFYTFRNAEYAIEEKVKILIDNGYNINDKGKYYDYYGTPLEVFKAENKNGEFNYKIKIFEKYSK